MLMRKCDYERERENGKEKDRFFHLQKNNIPDNINYTAVTKMQATMERLSNFSGR